MDQVRIRCEPRNSDPVLANVSAYTIITTTTTTTTNNITPTTTTFSNNMNNILINTKLDNSITISQWNLWGLSLLGKVNILNSLECDIITFQEINHPSNDLINHIHKPILDQKERVERKGGGTITLASLPITSNQVISVNKDSNLQRLVIDGVFVLWLGNIYLNKGHPKQIQKLFSIIQNAIPEHERQNLILIGDFNIKLEDPKNSKTVLLRNLCKQFSLTINEPSKGTRGESKLDYLISGSQIMASLKDQISSISDHDILTWRVDFKATTKPKEIFVPNKILATEITKQSILDENTVNASSLIESFLTRRKLKRRQAFVKLKRTKRSNEALQNILLTIKDEDSIMEDINQYWGNFWDENELKRYSPLSKEAFNLLKTICKYHLYEKRDGSIVNQILMDDGKVTTDKDQVSSSLIDVLKSIQHSDQFEQYTGKMPFPDLPELDEKSVKGILSSLSTGKALSYDLFSDMVLRDDKTCEKLSTILKDLWSNKLNDIQGIENIFKTRLVALNKVHPNIPKPNEFRPIIIMSLIVKIMESRWLPKLKEYMITKMCPAQTGFVPGQGVFTNIFRAIRRVPF